MSSLTSVTRRYTPPTCTLEVSAKNSPLSRWMGQAVLKNLRFKLSFDDPRSSEDQWITVRGDRTQLQALSDAVTTYVQNFLSQSNHILNRGANHSVAAPDSRFEPSTQVATNAAGIYLQPNGMLAHELHLGSLATESSGSTIKLSVVQLADLATALDECSADVVALPTLNRPAWTTSAPAWGTIAAAAIAVVGLGVSLARVFEPSATQTATTASQGASSNDQRLAVQPLPSSQTPSPLPLPTAPLPLTSVPPSPTTAQAQPNSSVTASPAPTQTPKLKISQQPPVDAPAPANIPGVQINQVPVAALPNQARSGSSAPRSAAKTQAEPAPPAANSDVEIAAARQQQAATTLRAAQPEALSSSRSSASATIPQIAEAKTYFQQRWKVPEGLAESIEYSIKLAPNGTIAEIQPLGEVAGRFLDRTGIPPKGEKFVSPVSGGSSPTLRVVFSPNGKVQTFLEAE